MAAAEVRAAGLIIFRQLQREKPREYLLLQASYGERHWTPPKGHVDPGEDEKTTAIRETQEESGLGPKDYTFLEGFQSTLYYKVQGKNKSVTYWLAKLNNFECPVKLSEEHQDFRWRRIKEACDFVGYKEMQDALMTAEKFLSGQQ
eukprot:Seg350.21 transcript_id=Seg350.21/GoldUCD/mRNA.D3Y31 product="Bis 5'-nucleosyl-tetraphosphatase" protein_id=Seg350.21/GoldUCD/D3Y31